MTLDTELRELDVPEHRPGFFDDLRDELGGPATRVTRPRLLLVAAAAAIVAGALAFGLTRGSEVAAAAQVRAAVERALASTGSISGILVNNESGTPGVPGVRARFVLSSTGAFRIDGIGTGSRMVYDPARNTETFSDHSEFARIVGLAAGPPDAAPATFVFQRGLGSVVAALADAGDTTVENVTYDGRPAWLLRTSTGNSGEQALITVDRATGMPVQIQVLRGGHLSSELRIEQLRVSKTHPRITPPVPAPGQNVRVINAGYRHTSLAGARDAAGYAPLVPKRLPHGFRLTDVAFASSSRTTGEEGGGGNPPSRDVISLAYRRGFDEIIVTTRRTGPDPSAWKDPLQVSSVAATAPSPVTFTGGALAGESGYVVIAADAFPHVWAAGPKLVVTIAGTVGRADLLKVANSLK